MIESIHELDNVNVDNSWRMVTHKTYSESSYKKSDAMLTPFEFESFERKTPQNNQNACRFLSKITKFL